MATAQANSSDGISVATGRWVLLATILASSMAFIDGSALNVALPKLQADLQANAQQFFWIINGYYLPLAALILVGGSLGDRFGRKRVFMAGIGLFTLASVICGFAPTADLLIAARVLQGVGGALMIPGSLALISALFPADKRGMAIGTWSAFSTITTVGGPILGGVLADNGLWRGVFFINIPLALISLYALVTHVPESQEESNAGTAKPLDFIGAILVSIGLAGLSYGFIQASDPLIGFNQEVILALIIGVVGLIAFLVWEWRAPYPMMPLKLFKSRTFSGANALTLFLYGALSAWSLFFTLNLQQVQGYNATQAGFSSLPFALMLTFLSRRFGSMADRYGPRLFLTVGPAVVGVGFAVFGLIGLTSGADAFWTTFLPAVLIVGLGMGITVAPLTTAVMGAVSQQQAGTASGINNAVSRVASVLAIAILGVVALTMFRGGLDSYTLETGMSDTVRSEVLANASRLGDTASELPDTTSEQDLAAAQQAVRLAFLDMFRVVCFICAGLAWLSALLAWLLVEPGRAQAQPQDAPLPAR